MLNTFSVVENQHFIPYDWRNLRKEGVFWVLSTPFKIYIDTIYGVKGEVGSAEERQLTQQFMNPLVKISCCAYVHYTMLLYLIIAMRKH